jgi:prepilin-type N-terminal cleavage/methylation domain-containing protein
MKIRFAKGTQKHFRKSPPGGFTLVEVVVSMTLLVVVATVLLTGVMAAGKIRSRSVDLTRAGYEQAALLEQMTGVSTGSQVLIVNRVQDYQVWGDLLETEDPETGVGFMVFQPYEPEGE